MGSTPIQTSMMRDFGPHVAVSSIREKRRDSFSRIFPVCSQNPTWMFFLCHGSFLHSAYSSHFSITVLAPLESVSGPLGESHVWLPELLKLTKAYSFPINLPWATTQQLCIPGMGHCRGTKKSWLCSLSLFTLGPKKSADADTKTVKNNYIPLWDHIPA